MRNAFPLLALLGLAACGAAGDPPYNVPPATPINLAYACEDGLRPVVRYFPGGRATVRISPERAVELTGQESASGARYVGEGVVLWGKGTSEVMLEVDGKETRCERVATD